MKQKYVNCTNVQQEMAQFIDSYDWNYYATLTTSYEQTMPSARRLAHRMHDRANQSFETTMFFACEPYDVKDGYHIHALIKTEMDYRSLIECYQVTSAGKKIGKHQRIDLQKYQRGMGGAMYCAKYITKKLSDWDFLLPLPKNTLFS